MRPLLLLPILLAFASPAPARAAMLEPFVASYEAWYEGRRAGDATMQVVRKQDPNWQVDLDIRANRGFAGFARVNMQQSTVFDVHHDGAFYRPISQSTVRKALLFGRSVTGIYDWHARSARWTGDVSERRSAPVPLEDGDMSALLINLAVIRDAEPGKTLRYRFVDNGRARAHVYQVSAEPEIVEVADLSYNALRVSRLDDDGDEMIVWIADGVPTPIRILQRDDGADSIDLRLIEYRGAP